MIYYTYQSTVRSLSYPNIDREEIKSKKSDFRRGFIPARGKKFTIFLQFANWVGVKLYSNIYLRVLITRRGRLLQISKNQSLTKTHFSQKLPGSVTCFGLFFNVLVLRLGPQFYATCQIKFFNESHFKSKASSVTTISRRAERLKRKTTRRTKL